MNKWYGVELIFSSCQSVHVLRVGTWANVTDLCIASGGCRLWHHLSDAKVLYQTAKQNFSFHAAACNPLAIGPLFRILEFFFQFSVCLEVRLTPLSFQTSKARKHADTGTRIHKSRHKKHSFINCRSIVTCVCSFFLSFCLLFLGYTSRCYKGRSLWKLSNQLTYLKEAQQLNEEVQAINFSFESTTNIITYLFRSQFRGIFNVSHLSFWVEWPVHFDIV